MFVEKRTYTVDGLINGAYIWNNIFISKWMGFYPRGLKPGVGLLCGILRYCNTWNPKLILRDNCKKSQKCAINSPYRADIKGKGPGIFLANYEPDPCLPLVLLVFLHFPTNKIPSRWIPRLLVSLARPLEILMTALMSHINCDHRLSKMKQLFKSKIIIILIIRLMWNLNELVILSLSNNLTSVTWTVVNESECFAWKQKS